MKQLIRFMDTILKEYADIKEPDFFGVIISRKIEEFIHGLRETEGKRNRRKLLEECKSGIMTKIQEQFGKDHSINGSEMALLELLFCGFPLSLISLYFKKSPKTVIAWKSRLRKIIKDSDAPDKQLFLDSIIDYR